MADSIIKKVKGLFMGKKKETNTGSANKNAGFDVLNDSPGCDSGSQAADADVFGDGLDISVDETITEAPAKSDEIEPEKSEVRTEKTHERVARIAAEKNTKGYGL